MGGSIDGSCGLGLWCRHFQQYFGYIVEVSFIGGGNWKKNRMEVVFKGLEDKTLSFLYHCDFPIGRVP